MTATWADSTPWTTPTVAWTGAAITIADANATSNPTVVGFASSTVTVTGAATSTATVAAFATSTPGVSDG